MRQHYHSQCVIKHLKHHNQKRKKKLTRKFSNSSWVTWSWWINSGTEILDGPGLFDEAALNKIQSTKIHLRWRFKLTLLVLGPASCSFEYMCKYILFDLSSCSPNFCWRDSNARSSSRMRSLAFYFIKVEKRLWMKLEEVRSIIILGPEKFNLCETVKVMNKWRRRRSGTNLLVVRHQIAISCVALGQALKQRIDSVVIASLLFTQFAIVVLNEFFNFLFIHLNETLSFWINDLMIIFFIPNGTKITFVMQLKSFCTSDYSPVLCVCIRILGMDWRRRDIFKMSWISKRTLHLRIA